VADFGRGFLFDFTCRRYASQGWVCNTFFRILVVSLTHTLHFLEHNLLHLLESKIDPFAGVDFFLA
jgi:hypothetical protein